MTRRACRVDANHGAIRDALRAAGAGVIDGSKFSEGFSDLVCFWRGETILIEVKDGTKPPSARKLKPKQEIVHALALSHGVTIHVVTSIDEALAVLGARVSV